MKLVAIVNGLVPPALCLSLDHTNNASQSSLESVSTMSGGDSLPRNGTRVDLSEIGDQVNR